MTNFLQQKDLSTVNQEYLFTTFSNLLENLEKKSVLKIILETSTYL